MPPDPSTASAPVNITKAEPKAPSSLETLVTIEGEALNAKDSLSLKHIAVNRPRSLVKTGHIIWVLRRGGDIKLEAISSQATLDKTTPFAQWMTGQIKAQLKSGALNSPSQWQLKADNPDDAFEYPFTHAFYAPFAPDPKSGGLLFTRDTSFVDVEKPMIKRMAQIFGVASVAMGRKKRARMSVRKRTVFLGTIALLALISLIPVPMTTLAPAEIVADSPYMITAPIDGVIESILIPPNTVVTKGTTLARFVDTAHRNDFILAGQEQTVAEAKLRQASLTSFIDDTAKRQIAVAKAEKSLAAARQNYAKDRLSKATLIAPRDGLAIYTDQSDWAGRPVSTGESIIQIANPAQVLLRIDAPLAIGETLQSGARVRLFLDSDPLNPIEAELTTASYYAQTTSDGHMAYEAFGRLSDAEQTVPRIGTRGVAKIYGKTAPLGFWLLRRPLTIIRQFFGI